MAKFCQDCGDPLVSETSKFCNECGAKVQNNFPNISTPIRQPVQNQTTLNSPKKRSKGEWIAILFCGGIILLSVMSTFPAGTSGASQKMSITAGTQQPMILPTPANDPIIQIKKNAQTIPYNNLLSNNGNYIGKTVYFQGKIIQIIPVNGDNYNFRVGTKQNQNIIEDIVYVNYKGSQFLKGDTIDLWGNVDGLETYSTVLGNSVTVPKLTALHVELVEKGSGSLSTDPISLQTVTPRSTISNQDGTISIKTSPGDAQIYINGLFAGMSPVVVKKPPGTYSIEIRASGYLFQSFNVEVNGGEITNIDQVLTRVPIRTN